MAEKGNNVRRVSGKKKNKPKIRFNIWMMIIIFALSFAGCFILYMAAANLNEDFFDEEFVSVVEETTTAPAEEDNDIQQEDNVTEPDEEDIPQNNVEIDNPVKSSSAVDISYLENCCLVTDSTMLGVKGKGLDDVIGNDALNASNVNTAKVESSYGTVTAYEILKLKKPMNVYIMLGSDIGVSEIDTMIAEVTKLVSGVKASVPGVSIYVMQIPPVHGDAEKNTLINEYNGRLLSMADSLMVHCLDTNTGFKGNDGNLNAEYVNISEEDGSVSISDKLYDDMTGYILTHTVS